MAPSEPIPTPQPAQVRSVRFPISLGEQVRSAFDVPAYVRRALQLEEAQRDLERRLDRLWFDRLRPIACDVKNLIACFASAGELDEWLGESRRAPWAMVSAAAASHPDYEKLFVDRSLFAPSRHRRYRMLCERIRSFNEGWPSAVATIDLGPVNRQVEAFNRWYPLERECAMRHAWHALDDFRPRPLWRHCDLEASQPLLATLE